MMNCHFFLCAYKTNFKQVHGVVQACHCVLLQGHTTGLALKVRMCLPCRQAIA